MLVTALTKLPFYIAVFRFKSTELKASNISEWSSPKALLLH